MNNQKSYNSKDEQLARWAKAMSHPARIAILRHLMQQEDCCFGPIFEKLPIAKATVSQHIKELKEAGLIKGDDNPYQIKYCIQRENMAAAMQFFKEFFACTCKEKK